MEQQYLSLKGSLIVNKELFSDNYVENLKKVISNSLDLIEAMRESDYEGLNILMRIEDMQEIVDYCNELGIMDKIILHDDTDKSILDKKDLVIYQEI